VIHLGSEAVDDGGVKFVHVGKVEIESTTTPETFGAQGTLVEATRGMEDERVVLELAVTGSGEDAVGTVERR